MPSVNPRSDFRTALSVLPAFRAFQEKWTLYRLERAAVNFRRAIEEKYNFDPNQRRVPASNSQGGEWAGRDGTPSRHSENRQESGQPPATLVQAEPPKKYHADLREHEGRLGAHTIKYHVGKAPEFAWRELHKRDMSGLFASVKRRRMGSFPSLAAANRLASSTLARNAAIVDLVSSGALEREFITAKFGRITGFEFYRTYGQTIYRETTGVGVYIIHDPGMPHGYRIQSAYPRND